MSSVLERINGVARCPYDPRHNSTAVVTESGELYAATVIDFSGRDPVIYRSMGGMPPLRTAQYNSKWLNGTVTHTTLTLRTLSSVCHCRRIHTPLHNSTQLYIYVIKFPSCWQVSEYLIKFTIDCFDPKHLGEYRLKV